MTLIMAPGDYTKMFKILAIFFSMLLFLQALAACTVAGDQGLTPTPPPKGTIASSKLVWQEKWDKTVALAKDEGTVFCYASVSVSTRNLLSEAFKSKFGITLDSVGGTGGELAAKLTTETNAHIYNADAIIAGGPTVLGILKPAHSVGSVEPLLILPDVIDPKNWSGGFPYLDKDKTAVAMIGTRMRYVLRNTEVIKEQDLTSYRDLLKPQWKGKMVESDPTATGAGSSFVAMVIQVYGIEDAKKFLEQLVKQEPVITRDWRQLAEWVARGKYPVGVAPNPEQVANFLTAGAPLAFVKVEEGAKIATGAGGVAVPVRAAHPNASAVFVNWLLSKEGQEVLVKGMGSPSRRLDVSTAGIDPMFLREPGEKYIYDDEEQISFTANEVIPLSKEIFASLLK